MKYDMHYFTKPGTKLNKIVDPKTDVMICNISKIIFDYSAANNGFTGKVTKPLFYPLSINLHVN